MSKHPGSPPWPAESPAPSPSKVVREEDSILVLLSRLPDGVLMLDRDWKITFANDEARRVSRITPDDFNSRTHWEIYPETLGSPLETLYRDCMATGSPGRIEFFYPPFNLWIDARVIPLLDGIAILYRDTSAQKRAEAMQEEADRQLQQVLEATTDAIVCLNRDWKVIFANRAAYQALRTDTLLGRDLWEDYPGTRDEPFASNYRTTMEQRIPTEFEAFYPEPLNQWFKLKALPYDEDGMIIFADEITSRKTAELERDAYARRLDQVLEVTTDGILTVDRNWTVTFLNHRAALALQRDDLVGKNLWETYPLPDDSPFVIHYRRTMDERVPTDFEAEAPEPSSRWFAVQCRPSDDGIVIFFRDVTARREAKTVLRQQRERIAFVQQAARIAFWTLDPVASIIAFDPGSYPIYGYPLSHFSQMENLRTIIHPEDMPLLRTTFEQAVRTGEPLIIEHRAINPEGQVLWLETRAQSTFVDGSTLALIGMTLDITDRRAAETALRRQRDLITFVQQASRIAFWTVDLASYTVAFDPGSYPVYGRPIAFLNNLDNLRSTYHPDDAPRVREAVDRAIRTGELVLLEFRVFGEHGNLIWVEARAQTTAVDGKPTTLSGMTIDITERRRSQEALAASEQRYRTLTELSPHLVWTGSPEGVITFANRAFLDYLGLTMAEINDVWFGTLHPDDRATIVQARVASLETGSDYEVEARILGKHGEYRWWWLRALPLRETPGLNGDPGPITSWLGVCIDIHERKTAADELLQRQLETERQRTEMETIYRTAPIGLALFDPIDFRYVRLNDRQAEIVGLPQEKILGHAVTEFGNIPGIRETFEQVAQGKPIRNALVEGELNARPAEKRYWTVNYFPVLDSDGSVRAISVASFEITHQKRAEAALIRSEKLAAVGRLASSISHEINNPLEAVTNLFYLIQQNEHLPDELRHYINTAQSELQRVCQIATQTLRFHRQSVRAALVEPRELLEAVLQLYQGRLINSGVKVHAHYRNTRPLLCFENDIRQVLNNLIANAIDAMRQGGSLFVRAHDAVDFNASPRPRLGIRITIADTGHGMNPATLQRLFEPFYTTKNINGTGLGLWISSGIVDRHHGRITLRTSQNPRYHGTAFTIFLPHIAESEIKEPPPIP